jgi:hypothetical protein
MQIETYPGSKNPVRVRVHYEDKDSDQILQSDVGIISQTWTFPNLARKGTYGISAHVVEYGLAPESPLQEIVQVGRIYSTNFPFSSAGLSLRKVIGSFQYLSLRNSA